MKPRPLFLLLLAVVLAAANPRVARAADVSFEFFQESLEPYGEWIEVGDYGYCWRPTGVDEDWAPYADGYWSYTDGGWTWVSYEEFGGIVYHYGRWVKVEDEGWVWVPDYEWGPAWVSWRNNDDYVGWAPLPPEATWEPERGISTYVDYSYDIAPVCYNFVRVVDFGAPVLRPLFCNRRENVVIIRNTVNVTNITFNRDADCVFNGGPDYRRMNRFVQRPIPALKLVRNTNITVINNTIINNNVRVRNVNAVQQGNQLTVVAPRVIRPAADRITALVKPNVRRVVAQDRVTKGWANVSDEQRAAVRTQFKAENRDRTPATAPARPVRVADLQVLPEKADPTAASPVESRKDRPRSGAGRPPAVTRGNPPAIQTPGTIPPLENPADPRTTAGPARDRGPKKRDGAEVPPAVVAPAPPSTPAVARERAVAQRPGKADPAAPADPATPAMPATPATGVDAKRNAAQERQRALQEKQQQAARQREQQLQQQQAVREAARQQGAEPPPAPVATQEPGKPAAPADTRQRKQPPVSGRQRGPVAPQAQPQPRVVEQLPPPQDDRPAQTARAQQQQAQEAARARAAQAAAAQDAGQRQRALEQQQHQQEAARARAAQAAQAAEGRQRAVEQQQAQGAARERAAGQQQAAGARAAQAAEGRQRAMEQQQAQGAARQRAVEQQQVNAARAAQAAEARQQQQALGAARQQAVERAQAQAAARQQQQQQQAAPRQAPPGKRKLTAEEIEELKNKQGR